MATTRPVVPQQARGEGVVGGGKQQKKVGAAGEGRNRRALGDIGNVITVRGIDGKSQPNRPITRSFCAQLLANAQAAAAAENNKKQVCVKVETKAPAAAAPENNKKQVCVNVETKAPAAAAAENNKKQVCVNVETKAPAALDKAAAAGKKGGAAKVAQKKITVKPKPEEVIQISPDTEEVAKPAKKQQEKAKVVSGNKKQEAEGSSKKNAPTFTSVLTARSKAACGLANKRKEQVIDIDAADANNDLAAVEYVEDMYKFYKLAENESRPRDYLRLQPDINDRMRAILVDWLIDVHHKFELAPETLYLTVNIIDRFLSVKTVPRRELQLLGISATLIASKYEEIWAPEVNDLVCISDRAYSHQQILMMEKTILGRLEWTLTVPTHYVFLVRFIKASVPDQEMENMVHFLAELGIMNYDTIMFSPSMVAASAVYAARRTLNKTLAWTETLKLHTGFTESQLMDCARFLVLLHSKASDDKLQVVYRKYSNPQRGGVALHPPAKALLPASFQCETTAVQN